ncbi:terminase large subunit [Vibrio phage 409E50-1]|nr:terminase large subunit [Vibrio phage 521E56-1]CAH9011441.1 terminase large subunit [Vibrio phage 402E50-1]CAH9011444.1 terminase large subunit [Vibrio phage 384E50-1]CAH9011465.1 terminase large subunit [Vibrio phage 409E50-1]CAH9012931.1 terminase large subunit [Vibrio phage 405E50-1]CAH9012978.1 terminase large subunit [Vibrio phage 413E50-1]
MEQDWLEEAEEKLRRMPPEAKELREAAMDDLYLFAQLVNPGYMYGEVHREIYRWMQDYSLFGQGTSLTANKLIMLPRAHLKSHMVATWAAWIITRHPDVTMLYVSATAELAETQLYAIKNIMGSTVYSRYWPEYIHPQEGKREKWSSTKLSVDHPKRKREGIRDATIATAGLTTNTTGWHADVVISDDLVVPENAYTEDGRESVSKKASQFTSIRNAGGFTMACGTRYHPVDIYHVWKNQAYDVFDENFEVIDKAPVWEVKEYVVETDGVFIWPRSVRTDNKAFGFDPQILARIKAEYSDRTQFFSQYYNDPNDPGSDRISKDKFQYFDPRYLKREGGVWKFKDKRLNIYAAVDFAFSLSKAADYTAIVVIGIDSDGDIYVLDIDRFKSDKTAEYFRHISALHSKWNFKKLRAEVTVAQKIIVNDIKDMIKRQGMSLSVEEYRPTRQEGAKEERIAAALEHRYEEYRMWHMEGGWTSVLEEELIQARPAHDDVKDALASAVGIAIRPKQKKSTDMSDFGLGAVKRSRFGGMVH